MIVDSIARNAKERKTGRNPRARIQRAPTALIGSLKGPEVSGPIVSLVVAMTGRKAALDDLAGEGVATLRTRP